MFAALRSSARRAALFCAHAPAPSSPPAASSISTALTTFARGMANKGYVTMKRRFKGLYGGKHIGFGNTVSFSHRKCASAENKRPRLPSA